MTKRVLVGTILALAAALLIVQVSRAELESAGAKPAPEAAAATSQPSGDQAAQKQADIAQFMEVSGTDAMISQLPDELLAVVKEQHPDLPDSFWQDVRDDMRLTSLRNAMAASYDSHFSDQDIKDLIAWYQMPIGKKLVAAQPAINHEFSMAQTRWTMQTVGMIRKKLAEQQSTSAPAAPAAPAKP